MGEGVTEDAGQVLAAWALNQVRMREIASRPYGVFDGGIRGATLFFDPTAVRPVPEDDS